MTNKSIDVMADLETAGTKAGCPILSIGATTFDLAHTFYEKISLDSCKRVGLIIDSETMAWWDKQSPEARQEAFSGTKDILQVCGEFATWFQRLPGDNKSKFIWGNGADFDLPILSAAYAAVGIPQPWAPWNGRCYRTLKNLYFGVKMPPFQGTKHNALADAINQAIHARTILGVHFLKED